MALKSFSKDVGLGTVSGVTGTLRLNVWEDSYDISNNRSNCSYELQFIITPSGRTWRASSGSWSLWGNVSNSGNIASMTYYGGTTTLASGSFTVDHNADGTGSFAIGFSFDSTWTYSGSDTLSGDLSTIPRASTASASNTNIGSTVRINTNRASSTFTHTITVSFGNFSKTWNSVGSYVDWNTSSDADTLYSKIPNSPDGTCTITCITYSNGSNIGSKTSTFKLIANKETVKPLISVSAIDTNKTLDTGNTIQSITGDTTNKTIIKYISNVAVTLTATARKSASISSTKISSGNGTFVVNTGNFTTTFTNVETASYSGTAIDTRGYDNTANVSDLTMLDYVRLSISPIRLYRTNQTANNLYVEIDGNYFKGSFNNTANTLSLKFKYKESGTSTWSSWATLTPTISQSENKYTFDGLIGSSFDYKKIYDFVFQVEDLAMIQSIEAQSVPGIPIIGIFEDFIEMWGEVFVYKN